MYTVTDPATGERIEEVPNATDEQVRAAIVSGTRLDFAEPRSGVAVLREAVEPRLC